MEFNLADDFYVLYTDGTTGIPKGVMWRREDLLFGAMGGGGGASAPITAPEDITERWREADTICARQERRNGACLVRSHRTSHCPPQHPVVQNFVDVEVTALRTSGDRRAA